MCTTLGPTYDPDNHPVTEWLDYYTRITLDRLEARNRLLDSLPTDIGVLVSTLADAGEPLDWAPTLLAARIGRLRTAALADLTGRSMPAARAELGRLTRAGCLTPAAASALPDSITPDNGRDAGESVPHLHLHLLGGRALQWPRPDLGPLLRV